MVTLLGINKILAIYVGPAGYAALGQFQNAIQMISALASGAINTGVTKYTAEYQGNEPAQRKVWQTAGTIALAGSIVLSILVFFFRERLAVSFLRDKQLSTVFVWLAATLVFFVFNTLLLAILNGKKEISSYVFANIAGSVLALVVSAFMVVHWGLLGALIALAVYQSLTFFVTLFLCLKTTWFHWRELVGRVDLPVAKNLAKYTFMSLTTAVMLPLSHILVRDHLSNTLGWEAAGYWEAMWRLSGAYLMLITTTLAVYYLPRLSELKDPEEIKIEIYRGYKIILPITILCGVAIFQLKGILIEIMFSKDFKKMEMLFAWQLVGDTLKIGSWILSYLILSRAMVGVYVITEIFLGVSFFCLTWILTIWHGIQGVVIAHSINYLIYWAVMAYYAKKIIKG